MNNNCCQNCKDRHLLCHVDCNDYLAEKARRDEINVARHKWLADNYYPSETKKKAITKTIKRHNGYKFS
ncbi:hypothetical protein phiCTP1_gp36 [Clostridium phage phiCTP1]|uniref:hypothetical protein n=1 Tax=Clostridium phage phiCTP1 TaxID=871584 RepID=UPI0001E07832|nr:hypothetical protein phiCTP1_gp36 [Clostridium phage phiCTP1]ADL40337.1 hypothetical phage protein [Clostridium phage phiCTP1]